VRHDIRVTGLCFGLRPVVLSDAPFILSLRTDPELARYINPTSDRLDEQKEWMQRYFERPTDYYWIITRTGTQEPEGAIAIYDVDRGGRQAEWGRWILKKGSLAAIESALLIYRVAFDELKLGRVYCRTVSANRSVVSFHTSCGLAMRPDPGIRVNLRGTDYYAVEQYLTEDRWPSVKGVLDQRACSVARLLAR
jgi:RimJ/RimL family protein N-acetyltransferase